MIKQGPRTTSAVYIYTRRHGATTRNRVRIGRCPTRVDNHGHERPSGVNNRELNALQSNGSGQTRFATPIVPVTMCTRVPI